MTTVDLPVAPNGLALLCLLVLAAGCWWRMHRAETLPHESLERLLDLDTPLPSEQPVSYDDPAIHPWIGSIPDDLDPDAAHLTLLPDRTGRVRS